jgi:glyoxylase-like metal-dependent hydrolase (beta-lactamase superfamily II)
MAAIHGRFAGGFSWQANPNEFLERSSTALAADGRAWLVDPTRADGIGDEIAALGKVAAIVLTIGWHDRAVDWFAALYGVPVYAHPSLRILDVKTPVQRVQGVVPNSPLRIITCGGRGVLAWWTETALWWPEQRTLVTGDAIGTASYFVQRGQRLTVHPLRRLSPPVELRELPVERLHPGHGRSVAEDVAPQLRAAINDARSNLPAAWWHSAQATLAHFTGKHHR